MIMNKNRDQTKSTLGITDAEGAWAVQISQVKRIPHIGKGKIKKMKREGAVFGFYWGVTRVREGWPLRQA